MTYSEVVDISGGIFIAGCYQTLQNIPSNGAQASAAAVRALAMINKRKVEIEVATAADDEQFCSGCKTYTSLCSYNAVSFDEEKKVSAINEVLCKGCDTCFFRLSSNRGLDKAPLIIYNAE